MHSLQLYVDDHALADNVTRFMATRRRGEAAVLIVTPEHRALFEPLIEPPVTWLDARTTMEALLVDGMPDRARFEREVGPVIAAARRRPGQVVRAYGEMVAVLWADGKPQAAVALEALWNEALGPWAVDLLCAYPLGAFRGAGQGEAFTAVCNQHDDVRPTEALPDDGGTRGHYIAALQQQADSLATEVRRSGQLAASLAASQAELIDFCENAPEPLHRVGPDGTILWANEAELQLMGYAASEYIGRNIAEFHVDQGALGDVLATLARGEPVRDRALRVQSKDGTIHHVRVNSNGVFRDGRFVATRCFTRDVTAQIELERERRARLDQLAEADRRKDEFLAMLAHELRNPLTPILTAVELVRHHKGDPDQVEKWVATIDRQANLMRRLVEDLLDISRITLGKIVLQPAPVSLRQVVETGLELARPQIVERRQGLSVDLPEAPIPLWGDAPRLAQMFGNLLHNASKFTPAGGRLGVRIVPHGTGPGVGTDTDGAVDIEVWDQGAGIPSGMQERIFDLFVQAGAAAPSSAASGLGLGLTVVRRIAQLHGGSVVARSPGPGQGSVFTVSLPVHAQTRGSTHGEPAAGAQAAQATSRRVLVVDDNDDVRMSLEETLRLEGHAVQAVGAGEAALRLVAAGTFDVAVLDIGMPGMGGLELARRLRAADPSMVLVALSGYAQASDRAASRAAGFDHHLAKPPQAQALREAIEGAARREAAGVWGLPAQPMRPYPA